MNNSEIPGFHGECRQERRINKAAGQGMADAWDGAIAETAAETADAITTPSAAPPISATAASPPVRVVA